MAPSPAPITAAPSGWTIEPPLHTYAPRRSAPAGLFAATGLSLPPEPVVRPPFGWTVALPDLPAFRRYQAMPESTGRIDRPVPELRRCGPGGGRSYRTYRER
jgi:hypothetical protein